MRKVLLVLPFLFILFSFSQAQSKIKPKKYPSLFWEITGNGMKKPSYLFGTMHVSNKMAFFLSDSFYIAIKNADVVALETNPESWQEDMDKYEMSGYGYYGRGFGGYNYGAYSPPTEYLTINSFKISKYEKRMEAALYLQPSVINNLLYRSYNAYTNDFEEDTYLDLYIYQLGKKSGKRVAGVEQYQESMRLMLEAYRDASKEKNRKVMSYDIEDDLRQENLQEAYRSGNLDWLDSINRVNSESAAFDEKFIFKRNELQANSIDSILKKSSLFVGVGAAHLPGQRGVIEILRRKGYKLRPVMMLKRDDKEKDKMEKVRVPVSFQEVTSDDGFYKVKVPGKLFDSGEGWSVSQQQYADMANGSYYMVTRVQTENLFWGHSEETVLKKIDSVLYENVPGKIIDKKSIEKNGFKGLDITNRTRRGDVQRYNIFVTPFELLVFKISGTGDYVLEGKEADEFLNSIQLRSYDYGIWQTWQPSWGGFSAEFPHKPFTSVGDDRVFEATDKTTATQFTIIQRDVHNYGFAEEDTFDLALIDESFASSEFIDKQLERKQGTFKGYPSLDCKYRNKDGSVIKVRYLLQGPHYYVLAAHAKKENPSFDKFLSSFTTRPFIYNEPKEYTDTSIHFTVKTTWYPEEKKEKIELPEDYGKEDEEEDYSYMSDGEFKGRTFANDSTGEKIFVSFFKTPKYVYEKDSSVLDKINSIGFEEEDSTWTVRKNEKSKWHNLAVSYRELSDSNSSRLVRVKTFYNEGVGFVIMNEGDTLTPPSSFVKNFFDSFQPADTIKGYNPFVKKSGVFFTDYFSTDTVVRKKAISAINIMDFDSTDFPSLKKAIAQLSWADKKYLDLKESFIQKLGKVRTGSSADYLKQLYFAAGDTTDLQYTILESLLNHKNTYAFQVFKDIITNEPPVLGIDGASYNYGRGNYRYTSINLNDDYEYYNNSFIDELGDSLQLTRTILPELLPLMNLDDYEYNIMSLLGRMVDSNLVDKKDYDQYFSKFLIEAKHEMKKQAAQEMKKSIAEASKEEDEDRYDYGYRTNNDARGNDDLALYAKLLIPYYNTNPNVKPLFDKLLVSGDKRLRYDIMYLMLQHKQKVPDSLFGFFAGDENFRYELYMDLVKMGKTTSFPAVYNTHLDLAKSKLLQSMSYNKPDSLYFLDKIKTRYRSKEGYIYFFKYKEKKDDPGWKIASAGLIPLDKRKFLFDDDLEEMKENNYSGLAGRYIMDRSGFTQFSSDRLEEDQPLQTQLQKMVRKMMYSKRKSARIFYNDRYGGYDYVSPAELEKVRY